MRIFSVDEANELIPALTEAMESIFFLNDSLKAVEKDAEVLLDIWGEDVYQKNHVDNGLYLALLSRQEQLMNNLRQELKGIQKLGCFVKDIEHGLVDFYFELDGKPVFLCWRYGEERIRYWHFLSSSFSGRKPLTDLLAARR